MPPPKKRLRKEEDEDPDWKPSEAAVVVYDKTPPNKTKFAWSKDQIVAYDDHIAPIVKDKRKVLNQAELKPIIETHVVLKQVPLRFLKNKMNGLFQKLKRSSSDK